MVEPLLLRINGFRVYSTGLMPNRDDGVHDVTRSAKDAARWTKVEVDELMHLYPGVTSMFTAIPLSKVRDR